MNQPPPPHNSSSYPPQQPQQQPPFGRGRGPSFGRGSQLPPFSSQQPQRGPPLLGGRGPPPNYVPNQPSQPPFRGPPPPLGFPGRGRGGRQPPQQQPQRIPPLAFANRGGPGGGRMGRGGPMARGGRRMDHRPPPQQQQQPHLFGKSAPPPPFAQNNMRGRGRGNMPFHSFNNGNNHHHNHVNGNFLPRGPPMNAGLLPPPPPPARGGMGRNSHMPPAPPHNPNFSHNNFAAPPPLQPTLHLAPPGTHQPAGHQPLNHQPVPLRGIPLRGIPPQQPQVFPTMRPSVPSAAATAMLQHNSIHSATAASTTTATPSNVHATASTQTFMPHAQFSVQNQLAATSTNDTNTATSVAPAVERDWEEYTDPTTGNPYYSNGVTTQWTKPEVMIQAEEKQKQEEEEPPRKIAKTVRPQVTFDSKEEALQAFHKLLMDHDVTPVQKWTEVVTKLQHATKDAGLWKACEGALSTGERKQALAEYQTKFAKDLRTKERLERLRAKEAFLKYLSEMLPKMTTNPTVSSSSAKEPLSLLRFRDVQPMLQKDDRYHAIEDDATREALFVEFVEEQRKKDERRKVNEKREAEQSFLSFLKELKERDILKCREHYHLLMDNYHHRHHHHHHHRDSMMTNEGDPMLSWDSFVASLDTSIKEKDSRFLTKSADNSTSSASSNKDSIKTGPSFCSLLSAHERDVLFERFVVDERQAEEEDRRRQQEDEQQVETAQREFFRDSLVGLAEQGKILPSSSYLSVVDTVLSKESSFVRLQQHNRDRPRELFDSFINDWNELYRRDRLLLSDIVRRTYEKHGRHILDTNSQEGQDEKTMSSKYERFCETLFEEASQSAITHQKIQRIISEKSPVSSAQLYFNELQQSRGKAASMPQTQFGDAESSEDEGEIAEESSADV